MTLLKRRTLRMWAEAEAALSRPDEPDPLGALLMYADVQVELQLLAELEHVPDQPFLMSNSDRRFTMSTVRSGLPEVCPNPDCRNPNLASFQDVAVCNICGWRSDRPNVPFSKPPAQSTEDHPAAAEFKKTNEEVPAGEAPVAAEPAPAKEKPVKEEPEP